MANRINVGEVDIIWGILSLDASCISTDNTTQSRQTLSALDHQLACIASANLNIDIPFKQKRIAKAQLQCRNSHALGYSTEVKDALLVQPSQIDETVLDMIERIENHFGAAV